MDIFNNEKGIKVANNLIAKKMFSKEKLEQEGLRMLQIGELIVLEKSGLIPKWQGNEYEH
ncbi:MAG: hypothetical protein KDD40_02865 [Bdellovibrionales bacterium]|nr:hypothetical protein [Bdellovibrionales bacterium]